MESEEVQLESKRSPLMLQVITEKSVPMIFNEVRKKYNKANGSRPNPLDLLGLGCMMCKL